MKKETWKAIDESYEVSNTGKVRSKNYRNTGKTQELSILNGPHGYKMVILHKKTQYIHRLVAEAFLENAEHLEQINHKDEDKSNNNVDNLEWCSAQYNLDYGSRNEKHRKTCAEKKVKRLARLKEFNENRKAEQKAELEAKKLQIEHLKTEIGMNRATIDAMEKQMKKDRRAVLQCDADGKVIKEWETEYDVYKELGINIRKCLNCKQEFVVGYRWMFKIAR